VMRIVFVGPFALQPKRTMAVRALPLARELARRGHQVLVLLPPWDHPDDAGRRWQEGSLTVENLELPLRVGGYFHLALAWRLTRAALQFRPDVVHCFKPKSYSGLTAWMLWHLRRVRVTRARLVVDADDWEGKGGWNDLLPYTTVQRRFFDRQEQWGLTHCDSVTVASRCLETLVWSLGVRSDLVHYIPNGCQVPLPRPDPADVEQLRRDYGFGEAPVAILYTRFFESNLDRVVDVMHTVCRRNSQMRWLVIGKGLFHEEDQLLREATRRGFSEQVVYVGWLPAEKLAAHLDLGRVGIYPYDDNLINRCKCAVKLIDLLSAGVPVVADSVGQNREYIRDGVNGRLIENGNTQGFADAVLSLLGDQRTCRQYAEAARIDVAQRFAWQCLADTVEEAYRA